MYKTYISLEVRVLLLAAPPEVKTFCGCSAQGSTEDEKTSCPVCRGESGALPILNPLAVRKAYLLIRSLGCSIVKEAAYERNLNTPLMPKDPDGKPAIALSRLSVKLGTDGAMDILFHSRRKRIRIIEVRLEEDAGRLTHSVRGPTGQPETRMDYSNAGMPSLRIQTAADFEIGEEAEVFLSELRRQIQYLEILPGKAGLLGTSSEAPRGKQASGKQASWKLAFQKLASLENIIRCNAYVAMAPYPEEPEHFVKLRNLNSLNFVGKAVNIEMSRQEEIVLNGGTVLHESRIWNAAKNATEPFRIRAEGEKPRFIREDLPPFIPGPGILDPGSAGSFSVELPEARRNRMMTEYGLKAHQAEFVCDEKSRADYFEKTLSLGTVSPEISREAAQWMSSYIIKECKRLGLSIADSPLTPERFAKILNMLRDRRIHGSIAKQVVSAVLEEDRDPQGIIKERGWEQLTNREAIKAIVTSVIEANAQEVRRIREGDARPIQFLTGLIMKKTDGLAEPTLVKDILRELLSVSLVYVLSMGGAISGRVGEDGAVETGDEQVLRDLLAAPPTVGSGKDEDFTDASKVRFESINVGRILSEEIIPSDWAILIEAIAEKLNSGTANGIVIAHGTDTLPYTAPLIYWLFADANAPIVFAASSTPPGASPEAKRTMKKAVSLALGKTKGVYVVHGGKVLSPLNLKFEHIGVDGFRNWNMEAPIFSDTPLLTGPLEADQYILSRMLENAVNSMCVIRLYPGIRPDYLASLMDKGVKNFFLELYDTGTAGFREGPYSLKRAFTLGKRRGARFYCSSQQEGIVDFSGYTTSRELWRLGAVPMGAYTTETAVARFLAASIIADSDEELAQLMDIDASPPS
ncbi:asparaginase domain-containing protein [Treponema primitia]|uniref:asparaginase domain-containing protein n=1 Tax=Treponema primitia TaxID=88058 RepID=UPI00397EE4D7